jgi:hypothetical protein
MVLLATLTLLYFSLFFNRFAGLRSGSGEFTTGMAMLHGQLPYRDYFSATPPLNTLKSALILHLFGPLLIVSRAAGAIERVLIALLLFRWLSSLFAARFAFAASLVTIIVSSGDMVDPVASYNHDAILWAMLSGFAASRSLVDAAPLRRFVAWSAASGLFAGLCLATKQTVGLGAVVVVPTVVAVLLWNGAGWRRAAVWLSAFACGVATPILCLGLWLARLHLWMIFLNMAFLQGPAAKGGHASAFLLRDLLVAVSNWYLVLIALVGCLLIWRPALRSQARTVPDLPATETPDVLRLGLAFAVSILLAWLLAQTAVGAVHNASKIPVYMVFLLIPLWLLRSASVAARHRLTPREQQFALFAAVSFSSAFFLSLSWPAFEAMALPGFGLLAAAALDGSGRRAQRAIYAVLAIFVFLQTAEKLDLPFGFNGLDEDPVRLAVQPSTIPQLRGLRLAPGMNTFLDGTLQTIKRHTEPGDTIFTYPEMGLFYELSGRTYPTLSGSHNVDVVNDTFAREEAERILARRPAVVIYLKPTADDLRQQDYIWRFGKPSGQHVLISAIDQLTRDYTVAGVYPVGQDGRQITVFYRR